jgi:hypothetical protein
MTESQRIRAQTPYNHLISMIKDTKLIERLVSAEKESMKQRRAGEREVRM